MTQSDEGPSMSEGRALLTPREREALTGEGTDSYRYKTRSYFRRRLEKLQGDVEHLAEYEPDLLRELREIVCLESGDVATDPETEPRPPGSQGQPAPAPDVVDTADSEGPSVDVVEEVAEGWDDRGDRLEARKAAARAVLEYAHEQGGVSKQEAKEEVYPEHEVDGQNPRTWYRKNIRPVLNEAAEYNPSTQKYELLE